MIKPGTKYVIVRVHEEDGRFGDERLIGSIISAVRLRRYPKGTPQAGWYYGEAKAITGWYSREYPNLYSRAVYLRRVKEEKT